MEEIKYDEDNEQIPTYIQKCKDRYSAADKISPLNSQVSKKIDNSEGSYRKDNLHLKKLLKKGKINNLVKNFCNKIKRNNQYNQPVQFDMKIQTNKKSSFEQWIQLKQGYEMSISQITILTITNILIILTLTIFYTLSLIFPQVQDNKILRFAQVIGLIFYVIEMISNFASKKYYEGREMIYLKEISFNYLKGKFLIDLISLIILCVDISAPSDNIVIKIFRLIILLKLSQSLEKLEVIQNIYITTFYRQQYWGLFNVFLINFSFAHILSILLNAIALLDSNNWLAVHSLQNATWYEKYVWGYYWGTTTMLTVGYGDFVATNYKEAICLIFIEMFSCITLAYTINCVGNLVSNIRQQGNEKNKNLKIFHQMSKKNKIDYELENRINNYIQESYQIKKEFNFDEQDNLLSYLPESLKSQYLNSANIKIFKEISFLKDLTLKTQALLSEKIVRLITHPEQVIQKKDQHCKLILLNQGKVGMSIKNTNNSSGKAVIVETIEVQDDQSSKLISLGFLRSKRLEFDIKSLSYSILFYIEKDDLINLLKMSSIDYEHFCVMRDRSQYYLNDDELYKCDFCPSQYHSKFKCPKIHFIPIKQHVTNKYMHRLKVDKQKRKNFYGRKQKYLKHHLKNLFQYQYTISNIRNRYFSEEGVHTNLEVISQDTLQKLEHTESIRQVNISHSTPYPLPKKQSITVTVGSNPFQAHHRFTKQSHFMNPQDLLLFLQNMNKTVQFWNLQCDVMQNWKYYLPSSNPMELNKDRKKR